MKPGRPIATLFMLGLTASLVLPAQPVLAADWPLSTTLGFRTGSSTQEIGGAFETTSFHMGPMFDLRWGDIGLGFAFLWATYESDATLTFPLPDIISQIGGPSTIVLPAKGRESARFDYDLSLKYRINQYVTPFIGYRKEILDDLGFSVDTDDPRLQAQMAQIAAAIEQAVAAGVLTPQQAQQIQASLQVDKVFFDLELDFVAFGASLQYPIEDLGLVPYFVGTGFAWAQVGDNSESFPGFSIEGGAAYLLGRHWEIPLYVTLSVKYQWLEGDEPLSILDEFVEGASEVIPVEEKVLNTNVAIFYQFDL